MTLIIALVCFSSLNSVFKDLKQFGSSFTGYKYEITGFSWNTNLGGCSYAIYPGVLFSENFALTAFCVVEKMRHLFTIPVDILCFQSPHLVDQRKKFSWSDEELEISSTF